MNEAPPVPTLLALARERFGELSTAEEELFTKAPLGQEVTCRWGKREAPDPARAEGWGPERSIRGQLLEWMCTDETAQHHVHRRGPKIRGARIEGLLDLEAADIPFNLQLRRCALPLGIFFPDADLRGLFLDGSRIGPMRAYRARLHGQLSLVQSVMHAEAQLRGVTIDGDLACSGAQCLNGGKTSLHMDGATILGDVFLTDGFRAEGTVRLQGAEIRGDLVCSGASLETPGIALDADRAVIAGSAFLGGGFQARGEVRMAGATIHGDLRCGGGRFDNAGLNALCADKAVIQGNAFLDDGFLALGTVRLVSAEIHGNMRCDTAAFESPDATALAADSLAVGGFLSLRHGFQARGWLDFTRASVHGAFLLRGLRDPQGASLSLEYAALGVLADEEASWPAKGNLRLEGLSYKEIHHASPRDAGARKRWLALQPENAHTAQPYEQLAATLRRLGRKRDAREILIEKNRMLVKRESSLSLARRFQNWLLRLTLGYGLKLAAALFAGFILAGALVFGAAHENGLMAKSRSWKILEDDTPKATAQRVPYPCFSPLAYALDVFIPFVDFEQEDYWIPGDCDQTICFPLVRVTLEPDGPVLLDAGRVTLGSAFLYCFYCVYIFSGWFVTGILAVVVQGRVQQFFEQS